MKASTKIASRANAIEDQARKNPVSQITLACAMALMAVGAVGVHAQTTPTPAPAADAAKKEEAKKDAAKKDEAKTEVIVVTGLRQSIEKAISTKKDSDSIVEAISAEDIGKLPDNSIAESIARLPGLAAQRVNGRAQTISIRGLSGDFAGTILNGREQVSTGDNRAAEFDQYPSELLGNVLISKTPDGALIGQGLSGTIDLQTVRPLNARRAVAVNLRGEKNSLGKLNADSKDQGYRFSASYIDQFLNKTLGIALGYAHIDSPSQAQRWESWGYPENAQGVGILGGGKQYVDSTLSKRDGFMGVVQWRPSQDFESMIDLYYSKFDQKTISRGMEAGLEWSGAQRVPGSERIQGTLVSAATYTGVNPVIRNDKNTRDDDLVAFGWNNKFKVTEGLTLIGDISFSRAKRNEEILETYAGTGPGGSGPTSRVSYTQFLGGVPTFNYSLNYADPNIVRLTDAGGWGQDGYVKYPKVEDELKAFRLTAKQDLNNAFGFLTSVTGGINYTDREKSRKVEEFFLRLRNGPTVAFPAGFLISPSSLGFVGIPGIVAYDAQSAMNQFYNRVTNLNNRDIINKDWRVQEKVTTGFVKLDFDGDLGSGFSLKGNAGLQIVNTDQSSNATAVGSDPRVQVPVTDGAKYTDYLPSLNLALFMPGDQVLRLGAGRALARARLDQLRASTNFSVNINRVPTRWEGDGGNPKLKPFIADAYDISYEKYFGTKAYISVAGFYKDLKSFIYQDSVQRDFAGLPLPANITGALIPPTTIGPYSTPNNGTGGRISGYEVTASMPLGLFVDALEGFGFQGSFSDTTSKIKPNGPTDTGGPNGGSQPLPGLSKRVSNITAYYERYGFQARVSQRSRSEFVGEVTGFGADREFRYVEAERILDYQVGYAFGDGPLKGLSFLFQVNNATNEPYSEYYTRPDRPRLQTTYGRSYLFGVNYRF
jgi:iron complex outermembrane recepter protein